MLIGKNVLMILPYGPDYVEFCACFTRDNYTKLFESEEEGFAFLESNPDIISVVVLDIRLARESHYRHVQEVCADPRFAAIPIIAVSPENPTEEDMVCFSYGCSDFITAPCPWPLVSRRIFNAIRAKDSATFYEIENMLKRLPSNIFLKDDHAKYVFATHYWEHLEKKNDPNWTIRGKTDFEVRKDKKNAKKAYEADMRILSTGIGTRYVIEENSGGKQEFLELIKEPVFDDDGKVKGIIAQINDVTELEKLKAQVTGHTDVKD